MPAQVLTAAPLHHPFPTLASTRLPSSCSHAHARTRQPNNSSTSRSVASRVDSRHSADDMSATYPPSYVYDNHAAHNYSASLGQPAGPRAQPNSHVQAHHQAPAVTDSRSLQYLRYPLQPVQQPVQPVVHSQAQIRSAESTDASHPVLKDARSNARPPTPTSDATMTTQSTRSRRDSDTLVYHSLQIPKCISPAGGNLADFAAQVCLFALPPVPKMKISLT